MGSQPRISHIKCVLIEKTKFTWFIHEKMIIRSRVSFLNKHGLDNLNHYTV